MYFEKVKSIDLEVSVMKEYLAENKDFKRWALKALFD